MRFLLVLLIFASQVAVARADNADIRVPERMRFADLDLQLNSGARNYIADVIHTLTKSPSWYQKMVDLADVYLPVVDNAFAEVDVPSDLRYIIIMESAFRGDAVSKSNAVGFWQFKEPAAREVGLVINGKMDERKHIYRSSVGAARYFSRINRDFDNWLYAVIGYNRGPAGALAYIDQKNYGKKKMTVTGKTHWYGLKAIAYKLAFQNAVGKGDSGNWLQEKPTNGETSVAKLARMNAMDVAAFKQHNLWIKGSQLPHGQDLTYFVPGQGQPVVAKVRSSKPKQRPASIGSKNPTPKETKVASTQPKPAAKPVAKPAPRRYTNKRFKVLDATNDPEYGIEYVRVDQGESLVEIAVHNKKKIKRVREYNGYELYDRPGAGEVVYLKPAHQLKYHIVRPGETLRDLAARYEATPDKLRKRNRMGNRSRLHPGQKIYLKKTKPKGEKPLILENRFAETGPSRPVE